MSAAQNFSRRGFLRASAAAAGGVLIGFQLGLPGIFVSGFLEAECLRTRGHRRHGHALHPQGGDGAGNRDVAFHAAGRRAGMRLEKDPHGISRREPRVRAHAGRVRQREHAHFLRFAAPRGCGGARNAGAGGGAAMGRCPVGVPRRKQHGGQQSHQCANDVRQPGRGRVQADGAGQPGAERSRAVPPDRQAGEAPGHAGQGGWQRAVRHRCAPARDGVRRGGALPGVRRQGQELRCRQGEGRARREAGGADLQRRGRGGRQHLERHAGTARARRAVGRRSGGRHEHPGADQDLPGAHAAARRGGAQGRRCRGGAGGRGQEDRGGLRSPVPGARSHGAAQLHGGREWRISCAVWASTQGQSAAREIAARITGLPPEKVRGAHAVYGRRLRTARRGGLHRRGRGSLQGGGRAGEAHVVARRRHAAGSLPSGILHALRRRRWMPMAGRWR